MPENILILSDQIPHSVSAGNIQLLRLFTDYPPEQLMAVGPRVPVGAATLGCRYLGWEPNFTRLNSTRFSRWKRSLRAMNIIPPASSRTIRRLLNGFQPDVVLNLMQNSDYYEAAEQFCRAEGLPLVLIVHDTNEDFEPVFPWAQRSLFEKDKRIYRFATARFCVSPEMAAFNEKRFDVPGEVLYPIPDPDLTPRPVEMSAALRQPPYLTIGYAGALGYGYGEMILKLLPLFDKAGVKLELCSPKPAGVVAALLDSPIVRWHGYMESKDAMILLQERCDGVLLPYMDPPGSYERLYSTHFPSKLCDYLQLGMPILVIAPEVATGAKWWQQKTSMETSSKAFHGTLGLFKNNAEERIAAALQTSALKHSFGMSTPSSIKFFSILELSRRAQSAS